MLNFAVDDLEAAVDQLTARNAVPDMRTRQDARP
jgi:hypothetical protein